MTGFFAESVQPGAVTICVDACCAPNRRNFLKNMATFAAGAALPSSALGQGTSPARKIIDMHHHCYSPRMKEALARGGSLAPFIRDWTLSRTVEELDKNGVSKAVLSLSSIPSEWFRMDKDALRGLVRGLNEDGAQMLRDAPNRFGLFAFLSISDVEGTLKEIEYVFDVLKADGVGITTSYGDKWPGDPAFAPVFAELNRRKAIVYFHPGAPFCCGALVPNVGDSLIEYPQDTNRAVLSLMFSGAFKRYPDIRWIFSHGGGTLPMLAARIDHLSKNAKNRAEFAPNGVEAELRKLYFETANATSAPALAALTKLMPVSQIMFGTDFPYLSVAQNLEGLHAGGFNDADMVAIESGNAMKLIPRL